MYCRKKPHWISAAAFAAAGLALAAPSVRAQANSDPDATAKARLAWMREKQGNLWNVNADEGAFLRGLVEKVHAKRALEVGTSNGYSSIWIAMGLRRTGGHLQTLEIDPGRARLAGENFRAAGVDSLVTLKLGDARKEIPALSGPFDFVFIDAWKQDYVLYLDDVLPKVRPGGVIVAHNVTDLRDELQDFIRAVQTNPQLKTTIENPGPGGFSVSYKLPAP
ncbi:MAG: O-methyltransferase [Acidobacteriia bacterium]|nr:O-methyltransferase [Terriglobia bacterium]